MVIGHIDQIFRSIFEEKRLGADVVFDVVALIVMGGADEKRIFRHAIALGAIGIADPIGRGEMGGNVIGAILKVACGLGRLLDDEHRGLGAFIRGRPSPKRAGAEAE